LWRAYDGGDGRSAQSLDADRISRVAHGQSLAAARLGGEAAAVTPERYQQVKNIYQAVIELDSSRRAAFLDEACANNSALRQEVKRLVAYEAGEVSFMEAPALAANGHLLGDAEPSLAGQLIGPYRILRLMSEGGMGTVYLAERADQAYEKKVAI